MIEITKKKNVIATLTVRVQKGKGGNIKVGTNSYKISSILLQARR